MSVKIGIEGGKDPLWKGLKVSTASLVLALLGKRFRLKEGCVLGTVGSISTSQPSFVTV